MRGTLKHEAKKKENPRLPNILKKINNSNSLVKKKHTNDTLLEQIVY